MSSHTKAPRFRYYVEYPAAGQLKPRRFFCAVMSAMDHSQTLRRKRDVRYGPLADICTAKDHVRFTPESGHLRRNILCPLWANSGLMHCSKHLGAEDCRTSLFVCAYHNFSEVFSP
jgi:hypothetical protein